MIWEKLWKGADGSMLGILPYFSWRGAPTEVSLGWAPEGKRRPGRPKQTWRRAMLKQLTTSGVKSWSEAAELAKDRLKWQEMGKLMSSTQRVTRHSAN